MRVLAQELSTARPGDLSSAFDRFERRRRDDVRRVKREARFEAAATFLESPTLRSVRNAVVRHTPLFETFVKRRAVE